MISRTVDKFFAVKTPELFEVLRLRVIVVFFFF